MYRAYPQALIDSGAEDNLIDSEVATLLGCQLEELDRPIPALVLCLCYIVCLVWVFLRFLTYVCRGAWRGWAEWSTIGAAVTDAPAAGWQSAAADLSLGLHAACCQMITPTRCVTHDLSATCTTCSSLPAPRTSPGSPSPCAARRLQLHTGILGENPYTDYLHST